MEKILNVFTCFMIGFAIYLLGCTIDAINPHYSNIEINNIRIFRGGVLVWKSDEFPDHYKVHNFFINASPGDTISVEFDVTRSRGGRLELERIFTDHTEKEFLIQNVRKYIDHDQLKKRRIEANYVVPINIETGCGAKVFSIASFYKKYNLVSLVFPSVEKTPEINVCIK